MRIVLASTSPRRRELLALLGLTFDLQAPDFDEVLLPGRTAREQVEAFAQGKARSVTKRHPEALVIGSDTVIELDGTVLGKPIDLADARTMLEQMAGREHLVHTAVTICCQARARDETRTSTASVRMKPFDRTALDRYLATGDSLGKAGAYSIQGPGGDLIERLQGDFPTVVGLPIRLVVAMLAAAGVTVPVDVERLYREQPYGNWARFQG